MYDEFEPFWKFMRLFFLVLMCFVVTRFFIFAWTEVIPSMNDSFSSAESNIEEEYVPHEHEFGDWVITTEATEDSEGVMTRKCECGEEETLVIPQIEKKLVEEDVEEEDLVEEAHTSLFFKFLPFVAISSIFLIGVNFIFNCKKKNTDSLELTKEIEEEKVEEINPFTIFQETLLNNIEYLKKQKDSVLNKELKKSIEKSISIINDIYSNTDDKEFKRGNIGRLNEMYLESFKNLIEQYINLQDYVKSKDVIKTLGELEFSVTKFELIFDGILNEALDSDLLEASAESKTIINIAKMNGLLEDSEFETLVSKH